MRARTLCAVWGCRDYAVDGSRCETHRRRASPAWRRVARATIARADGVCDRCGAHAPLSAHHVRPLIYGAAEIVSVDQTLALCRSCQTRDAPQTPKTGRQR